ncbi:MAG: hypothetical protein NTV34_21160, partial [Proteobacteria bacterium]|nr:hypothetical protein [Pseudomonadota bacterium]
DRMNELKGLYSVAKEHALKSNLAFNPKMIALQPVIGQDAILILDQFRNVRHMAKVFSFLGVRRIPMFGHYEWRSIGLIEPFDPMFTGSYFVDVTGSYNSLPVGIRVPTLTSSPNLIPPNKVEEVDLSALGYTAVAPALMLTKLAESPRRKLDAIIPRSDKTTTKAFSFDSENVLEWPTYLFEVTSQGSSGSVVIRP